MAVETITISFNHGFRGTLKTEKQDVLVGSHETGISPYNMLFGALGSCLYATFLEIARKKQLTYTNVDVIVSGTKREEIPTTLNYVKVEMVVYNPSDTTGLEKTAKLAAKYCSIYETLSKVATMETIIRFEKEDV